MSVARMLHVHDGCVTRPAAVSDGLCVPLPASLEDCLTHQAQLREPDGALRRVQRIMPTMLQLRKAGIGAILDYAAENDVHSEKGVAGAASLSKVRFSTHGQSKRRRTAC